MGSIKDIDNVEWTSSSDDSTVIRYNLYTIQVDDLWYGEVVGKEVVLYSETIYYRDEIFINHRDSQYIFMLCATPPNSPVDEKCYMATCGMRSVIPIQPSTGKMYPLYSSDDYKQLEGQPPEYLKELIATEQQDILENGYDDSGDRLSVEFLGDVLKP